MLNSKAVCSGYAVTFDYFMYVLGIEHEHVSGNATNSSGLTGGHAWNRVLLDNQWYYVTALGMILLEVMGKTCCDILIF